MPATARRALALATLATLSLAVASPFAAAGEARIQVVNGLVSARFSAVPVAEAVAEIRGAANLEIVLPASVRGKTVTLSADALPLERFIRRMLDGLDVGGYALVYEIGQTPRLIVVESARAVLPEPAGTTPEGTAASAGSAPGPLQPARRATRPLGAPPEYVMPLVRLDARGISITPRGQYDRVDLTVSGRDGQPIRREYPTGTEAYFDVADERGQPLRDGSYSYELVVVPAVPEQIRERMEAVRESPGDRTKLQTELREEGWLPKEPLVQSGHFSVSGGLIVDGSEPEKSRRRR